MASVLDRVAGSVARTLLRGGTITSVVDLGERFRSVKVAPRRPAAWGPGQKVQFQVRGVQFRTYTPHGWDGDGASFLAFRPGAGGPAEQWLEALAPGVEVAFFGPQGAVSLDPGTPPVFVGDETSFALTAAWLHAAGPAAAPVAQLYEVDDAAEAGAVLARLGVVGAELTRRGDGSAEALAAQAVLAVTAHPDAPLVLTGQAQTIAAVRKAVKAAGLAPTARAKAHWDPSRTGLD